MNEAQLKNGGYQEFCKNCQTEFIPKKFHRNGQKFCSSQCRRRFHQPLVPQLIKSRNYRFSKLGEKNPQWKGDNATQHSGRGRAIRKHSLIPCEICELNKTERHHKDGNTLNNNPDNIQFLCRKHHMEEDGRLQNLIIRMKNPNRIFFRDNKGRFLHEGSNTN